MTKTSSTILQLHAFFQEQQIVESELGLKFEKSLSKEEWTEGCNLLKKFKSQIHFYIADYFLYYEKRWGNDYKKLSILTGVDVGTLENIILVAKAFIPYKEVADVSFSHHQEDVSKKNATVKNELSIEAKENSYTNEKKPSIVTQRKNVNRKKNQRLENN